MYTAFEILKEKKKRSLKIVLEDLPLTIKYRNTNTHSVDIFETIFQKIVTCTLLTCPYCIT